MSSPLTTVNQCFLQRIKELYHRLLERWLLLFSRDFTCSKSKTETLKTLEHNVKFFRVKRKGNRMMSLTFVLVFLLLTLIWCFCRWFWASKCWHRRWIIEQNLFWIRSLTLAYLHTNIIPPEVVPFNWLAIPN